MVCVYRAFNQWTYRSWSDAQDDYGNISTAMGCDETANDTGAKNGIFF